MSRMPPEIETIFRLAEIVKIKGLQIELEKYRCSKINKLAGKAKNSNDVRKAKIYYKVWGLRMALVSGLQKEHKSLTAELEKENKNVIGFKSEAKSLSKSKAKSKSVNFVGSQLKQVC